MAFRGYGVLGILVALSGCGSDELPLDETPVDDTGEAQVGVAESMDGDQMWSHLEALQQIADANGGHRSLGSSGYAASVEYVVNQLEAYGYEVSEDEFITRNFEVYSDPVVTLLSGSQTSVAQDAISVLVYSGSGDVTAEGIFVDALIPPPLQSNSSTSGCELEDFADFPAGSIALIQRGTCYFQDKVDNAVTAGAAAVIIFNEGQPGRTGVVEGTLEGSANNAIPVVGLSYTAAEALFEEQKSLGSLTLNVAVDAGYTETSSVNVLADTTVGDTSQVVIVGAHLDSVPGGPGINDNGTGVSLVLELARQVAALGVEPKNQLRFAFWGGEEFGLLGSIDYVLEGSESGDLSNVLANLNYDMVGSPNPGRFIYDGDGSATGAPGPAGSDVIEFFYEDWFDENSLRYSATAFDGRSDYGAFVYFNIPAGGLFTGAEGIKGTNEADVFGGVVDEAFDACYHQACDTIENVDRQVFEEMAGAAAYAMIETAMLANGFDGRSAPEVRPSLSSIVPDTLAGCQRHLEEPVRR
jgi:Zn-dependent M28 family amino/carboxypeptidase